MHRKLALIATLAPLTAGATPVALDHTGRLLDASGAPVNGSRALGFELWSAAVDGTRVHQESHTVAVEDGFYAVRLGAAGDLDSTEIPTGGLWLEVSVDGQSMGRSPVGFVPLAAVASSVQGGLADVSELRVGGTTVVATNRDLTVGDIAAQDITAADVAAQDLTATSLTVNGVQVVSPAGRLNTTGLFTRITARVTIPGSAYSLGENAGTRTSTASCPAGTQIVTWGTEESIQYWGSMTHWYATCSQNGTSNGIKASLYTEWGYGGHNLTCWGLCVKTP